MKQIVIYGSGGFGREVQWLIERINQVEPAWEFLGYLDDGMPAGTMVNGYPVLGGIHKLKEFDSTLNIACAVGNAKVRESIIAKINAIGQFSFPNLISPDVKMSQHISMGQGNIICAGNILTVNITIEDFLILNLMCTVGHDTVLHSFVTVYPGVNISGNVEIGKNAEIGTGTKIIQGKKIGDNAIIGAGAAVVRDIPSGCTAVGVPAKPAIYPGGGYKKLLIVGASGHGRVIAELARQIGYYLYIFFLDDDTDLQTADNQVIGGSGYAVAHKDEYDVIVAIGDSSIRKRVQESYKEKGVSLVSLAHPESVIAEDVTIGEGSVIMAGAVIQPGVWIGDGVIVNTASSIDHDCRIESYSHVAVGSHLAGNVKVGENAWIGAGATVINNVHICEHATIGAGAVAVRDIVEAGTYVGVPAVKK